MLPPLTYLPIYLPEAKPMYHTVAPYIKNMVPWEGSPLCSSGILQKPPKTIKKHQKPFTKDPYVLQESYRNPSKNPSEDLGSWPHVLVDMLWLYDMTLTFDMRSYHIQLIFAWDLIGYRPQDCNMRPFSISPWKVSLQGGDTSNLWSVPYKTTKKKGGANVRTKRRTKQNTDTENNTKEGS